MPAFLKMSSFGNTYLLNSEKKMFNENFFFYYGIYMFSCSSIFYYFFWKLNSQVIMAILKNRRHFFSQILPMLRTDPTR